MSVGWCLVMVFVAFGSGSCDPGLRVGAIKGGLEAVLASNTIEASPVGCASAGQANIVVTNGGVEPSVLVAPALSPGLSESLVKVPNRCAQGQGLGPSQSCSVPVQGSPVAQGLRTEFVAVEGTPGGAVQQNLSVTGLPNLSATPASVNIVVDSADAGTRDEIVTVMVGTMPAALQPGFIGPDSQQFSVSYSLPGAGPPRQPCAPVSLDVRLDAMDFGTYAATLVLDAMVDGGTPTSIPVTGELR